MQMASQCRYLLSFAWIHANGTWYSIDTYECAVPDKIGVESTSYIIKKCIKSCKQAVTIDSTIELDEDDPDILEMYEHHDHIVNTKMYQFIYCPTVNIIWLYLLKSWRNKLDFNFRRNKFWNDNSCVNRFNDTWYVSMHHILDGHSFVLLSNGTCIGTWCNDCSNTARIVTCRKDRLYLAWQDKECHQNISIQQTIY